MASVGIQLIGVELASVINEHAPGAIKTGEIKNHFGRKVAIVSVYSMLDLSFNADLSRMRVYNYNL